MEEKASRHTGHLREDEEGLDEEGLEEVFDGDWIASGIGLDGGDWLDGGEDDLTGESVRSIVMFRLDLWAKAASNSALAFGSSGGTMSTSSKLESSSEVRLPSVATSRL